MPVTGWWVVSVHIPELVFEHKSIRRLLVRDVSALALARTPFLLS
jgi:hypothetical protein